LKKTKKKWNFGNKTGDCSVIIGRVQKKKKRGKFRLDKTLKKT